MDWDDTQRLRNLELQAGEEGTFANIHHMSLSDPDSIYKAFETFTMQILAEGGGMQRTSTEQFLVDETIKYKNQNKKGGPSLAGGRG